MRSSRASSRADFLVSAKLPSELDGDMRERDIQLGGSVWDTEVLEVSLEVYVSIDIQIEPVCQLIHASKWPRLT
jgi:hypothetical protein